MRLTNKIFESAGSIPPIVYWDNFFPENEINIIREFCEKQPLEKGKIESDIESDSVTEKIRKSEISFVNCSPETSWLFSRLNHMVEFFNTDFYRFNLVGFDHFQYTVYNDNCYYNYHTDMQGPLYNGPITRKLSFSLILSDPSEYKGGEFEFFIDGNPVTFEQPKGRILAFPSYIMHRVNPVTEGVRKSIVVWAMGPRFV
jgi:PKHD-type hydroxylase